MDERLSPEDAVRRGVELGAQLIEAAADGDDDRVVLLLNAASPQVTANAAGYLLSCLREATVRFCDGDEKRAADFLRASALGAVDDGAENAAIVIINEALMRSDD